MARVLIIDDDLSLLRALRVGLGAADHEVITAVNGELGISAASLHSPDVIVVDLGLPDIDGLAVCRRIRQWSDVPIVVLSAADAEGRKVAALDGGADDYVTKPFGMAELEARIRTAIRHRRPETEQRSPAEISIGTLWLDPVHHEGRIEGKALELTAKDFDVLLFLARNVGKVCTHELILSAVWGAAYKREAQYLHAYVHRLRQKLGDNRGLSIKSSPGIGYVLVETPPDRPDP